MVVLKVVVVVVVVVDDANLVLNRGVCRSYKRLLDASDKISYALQISLNLSSAPGDLFLSGCHFLASR